MPVIQSISATGLPAARGGTLSVEVMAQSAEGLTLTYAWTASEGWTIAAGAATNTVTITAPASYDATGTATVTVTDTNARVAMGMAALSTKGNGAPVVSSIVAAPGIMTRNVPGTITVWASSPDGEPLTYDWTVPQGFTIISGQGTSELVIETTRFASGLAQVSVSDGSATAVAGVHLSTTDGSWGTSALIETDDVGSAWDPTVAMDRDGNAIAVWSQGDGTRDNVWSNRYAAGTGWGTATLIETDNAGDAFVPRVAMDGDGNAIAVWAQYDGTRTSIWANRYAAGTGWGTATLIETDNAGAAGTPQLAMDRDGNAMAVWRQLDGVVATIRANRYTAGTGWGAAAPLQTSPDPGTDPQVAMDGDGNAVAVWAQYDGTRNNIWANRYTAGTGWDNAVQIETGAGDTERPQVAADAGGNAIAVWHQSDGTRNNIWANRFSGGSWGTAVPLESEDAGSAWYPKVAMGGDGDAIAVWRQFDGSSYDAWANRFSGGGWGTAARIESVNAGSALSPQIAMDGDGNAIAVWHQLTGSSYDTWANRFSGGGWGSAAPIEMDNAGPASEVQVAMAGDGSAIAVWRLHVSSRFSCWANRFQ